MGLDALLSEQFVPLAPLNFFQIVDEVRYRKPSASGPLSDDYLLPLTTDLLGEEPFADLALAWNEEGLLFDVKVEGTFNTAVFPRIADGDSVELFVDTRDIKSSGFNTRFCHHFFFLPKAVDGHQFGELTHFRTEDAHELCDPKDLKLTVLAKNRWQFLIPNHCLIGYHPNQFDRLGFSYRIRRKGGKCQHFSVSGVEYALEQQPSLWSSLRMVK